MNTPPKALLACQSPLRSVQFLLLLVFAIAGGSIPSVHAAVLFEDDFSSYTEGSTPDNPPWSFMKIDKTVDGITDTVDSSASLAMMPDVGGTPTSYGLVTTPGSLAWSDYSLSVDLRRNSIYVDAGIYARYVDGNNGYRFLFSRAANGDVGTLKLDAVINGQTTNLGKTNFTMKSGDWYTFNLDLVGSSITASLTYQGVTTVYYSVVDTTYSTGPAGVFRNGGAGGVQVDNVVVSTVPEASAVTLLLSGMATLGLLAFCRNARSARKRGLLGLGGVVACAIAFGGVAKAQSEGAIFYEDFSSFKGEELPTPPWIVSGTEGNPEAITVVEGELRIASKKSNPSAIIGNDEWSDYTLSVDLKRNNSYTGAGIMGHCRDANHGYRLMFTPSQTWDQTGTLRLQKIDKGQTTVLGEENVKMQSGSWYRFTLTFKGSAVNASLFRDSDLVRSLHATLDGSFHGGKIGIAGGWNSRFSADRIVVQKAEKE